MKSSLHLPGLLFLALTLASSALGHDAGLSTGTIRLRGDEVEVTISLAVHDLDALTDLDGRRDGAVTQAELDAGQVRIREIFSAGCVFSNATQRLQPVSVRCQLYQADDVEVQLIFPAPGAGGGEISLPFLRELAAGHRMFIRVLGAAGETLAEQLASRDSPPVGLQFAANPGAHAAETPHSFAGFLMLGVEHIGTGYDHLLFLFGLLLVTRELKSSLIVISSFTLAHSITLGVATLNVVNLRPTIAEPLIALSIVYVGVENLLARGGPKGRWLLTFVFGLIHGFGFASVLRDLGVTGASGAVMPLFAFNLGVELGQLTVAAILLPLIWKLRNLPGLGPRVAPVCSLAIVAAGGFWFCQRVWS